ncbi:hypothetical protein AGMMS50255_6260 [Spirochaetia bacterium]|nr:hypothetical protein AGMMS50255_6260 [Spirochaetia bacterium]
MAEDIINRVFSFIGVGSEPPSDKDPLLRQTAKKLSQNKYAKFYRIKTGEIDPAFAQYIHDIYQIIYPVRAFLLDEVKIKKLKQISFEHFLSPALLETVRRLSPEAIEDRAGKTAPNDFVRQLHDDFAALSNVFDDERIGAVNKCYNLITAFSRFVLFDYASFLKKFNTAPSKFTAVEGKTLVQDIGNFYTAISALDPMPASADGDEWADAFAVMKAANGGAEVLPSPQWNKLLANITELRQSKILELMVRLSSKDSVWNGEISIPDERLCENWFEKKRKEIGERISEIANMQRNSRMQDLAKAIFGDTEIDRLTFYTVKGNKVYTGKGLEGFVYAAGINYLMAFIQDYVKKDIQEICDLVLVRGRWSLNNASLQMSEAFHKILDIIPAIEELDESLSEDGSTGLRLKGALLRMDREKTQIRYIGNIIKGIDKETLELIKKAVHNLIIVGKNMKALADDILKKESELIINWKELDGFLRSPTAPMISDTYKKINYFVQLMTLVTRPAE